MMMDFLDTHSSSDVIVHYSDKIRDGWHQECDGG